MWVCGEIGYALTTSGRQRATALALEHVHRPVPNAALLGGFAALTGQLALAAVEQAIAARFPSRVAAGNIEAARAAFGLVTDQIGTDQMGASR